MPDEADEIPIVPCHFGCQNPDHCRDCFGIFTSDEVIESTCDTENPEVCESCQ